MEETDPLQVFVTNFPVKTTEEKVKDALIGAVLSSVLAIATHLVIKKMDRHKKKPAKVATEESPEK